MKNRRCWHQRRSSACLKCLSEAEVGTLENLQSHLIKVSDDFIEEPQALDSLVVHLGLGVEVSKAWDGGKHHAHGIVGLRVQLLWVNTSRVSSRCHVFLNHKQDNFIQSLVLCLYGYCRTKHWWIWPRIQTIVWLTDDSIAAGRSLLYSPENWVKLYTRQMWHCPTFIPSEFLPVNENRN